MIEFKFDDVDIPLKEEISKKIEVDEIEKKVEKKSVDNSEKELKIEYINAIKTDIVLEYSFKTIGFFEKTYIIEFELNKTAEFETEMLVVFNKDNYPINKNDGEIIDSFKLDSKMFKDNKYIKQITKFDKYLSLFFKDEFLYQHIQVLPIYQ